MRFLLDTHSFLWFLAGDRRLSATARDLIGASGNEALLSKASLWAIAIKASLGKLTLARPFADLIPEKLEKNAISVMEIEVEELALLVRRLPILESAPKFSKYNIKLIG